MSNTPDSRRSTKSERHRLQSLNRTLDVAPELSVQVQALLGRLRHGELSMTRLQLAAFCGDKASHVAAQYQMPDLILSQGQAERQRVSRWLDSSMLPGSVFGAWVGQLARHPIALFARASLIAAECALPVWCQQPPVDIDLDKEYQAALNLVLTPCAETEDELTQCLKNSAKAKQQVYQCTPDWEPEQRCAYYAITVTLPCVFSYYKFSQTHNTTSQLKKRHETIQFWGAAGATSAKALKQRIIEHSLAHEEEGLFAGI